MRRFSALLLVVGLAACSPSSISPEMQAHAEKYFTAVQAGDVEAVLVLYDPDFYAATPRAEWARLLTRISEKLGKMQFHKLLGWRAHTQIGTGSGRFLELTYEVMYEKYPAQELIVVRRGLTGGAPAIIAHNINSRGLLLE